MILIRLIKLSKNKNNVKLKKLSQRFDSKIQVQIVHREVVSLNYF